MVLLGTGAIWRIVLLVGITLPEHRELSAGLKLVALGMAPYILLAALARRIGSKAVLIITGGLIGMWDMLAGLGAMLPGSSTDPIGLLIQPIFSILVVLPLALLAGYAVRTYR